MKNRRIINTNIRLDMTRDADRRAYERLTMMDRKKYKSYSRLVVIAVNEYFERQERPADDPYLETRAKEDAFLDRVVDTIQEATRELLPLGLLSGIMQAAQGSQQPVSTDYQAEDSADDALAFADSF